MLKQRPTTDYKFFPYPHSRTKTRKEELSPPPRKILDLSRVGAAEPLGLLGHGPPLGKDGSHRSVGIVGVDGDGLTPVVDALGELPRFDEEDEEEGTDCEEELAKAS